jgi:hypothetical protein
MRRNTLSLAAACLLALACAPAAVAQNDATFRQWGMETLNRIQAAFWLPQRSLYADEIEPGRPAPDRPAFMWGCGVQLSALAAAARLDRRQYAPILRRFTDGLQVYWTENDRIGGYDVLPGPKPPDRYYDDNAWIVLALCDAYEATRERRYLDRAEQTFRFVLSGEDEKLGGGIYWRERDRASKNTCSNAPTVVAALRLFQRTRKPDYRQTAMRLYDWINSRLQDADSLYFDNVRPDGSVEKTKWSYNTALMIRADCLLHSLTRERKYLDAAQRIARAAEARWVRPDSGAIADGAAFAHLLSEAFLYLYDQDRDAHWLTVVRRALTFLREKARDPGGYYGDRWDAILSAPLAKARLLDQASAARAFLAAARYRKDEGRMQSIVLRQTARDNQRPGGYGCPMGPPEGTGPRGPLPGGMYAPPDVRAPGVVLVPRDGEDRKNL